MTKGIIVNCPLKNKEFMTKTGEIIKSPCCRSEYCKRCSWYKKVMIDKIAPHNFKLPGVYQAFLECPYYKPLTSAIKTKVNRAFMQKLRRKYACVEYLHALEEQEGLLHVNYYTLSMCQFDEQLVKQFWKEALWLGAGIDAPLDEIYAQSVLMPKNCSRYISKYYEGNPEKYLPAKGRYKQRLFVSKGYRNLILTVATDLTDAQFDLLTGTKK